MESKWQLSQKAVKRAYALVSPVYDLVFDRVFYPGRVQAIKLLDLGPEDEVLEVGIGTGLNLSLYPRHRRLVGMDLSRRMLRKAQERIRELHATYVNLVVMDAMRMGFPDDSFDHVLATYVISAVPDPIQVLQEIKRVCRPKGHIVILNHFKSEGPVMGRVEGLMAPLITRMGLFKPDLQLTPLLEQVGLVPDQIHRVNLVSRVNLLSGWRLIRCINIKEPSLEARAIDGGRDET
ncbi:MAG: class I SAM-dependent methyltransferase [Candidatus Methylomirabilales bacterium]